jgi:signal transduction histidine kinase
MGGSNRLARPALAAAVPAMARSGRSPAFSLLGACCVVVFACTPAADTDPGLRIHTARLWLGDAADPPSDGAAGWRHQALPLRWTPGQLGETRAAWVRAPFALDAPPDEPWAVYLPELRMNAAVYLNGARLGDGGRLGERPTRNWNRPLYFAIPSGVLRSGANELEVRLVTSRLSELRLGALRVGPASALRRAYEGQLLRRITLRQVSVALVFAAGLLLGIVALQRPDLRGARWLAACLWLISFGQSDSFVRDPPMSAEAWQWANATAYYFAFATLSISVHRALGVVAPWTEVGMLLAAAAVSAYAWLSPVLLASSATGIYVPALLGLSYVVVRTLLVARRRPIRRGGVLLGTGILLLAMALHDLQAPLTGLALPGAPLATYVPVVIAVAALWLLLGYVLDALAESETLARELDGRVARKHAELAANFERMRALEHERAVAGERERMLREMHDGLGGQLVSTLAMVEQGGMDEGLVMDALRAALDDMRLMLDSLHGDLDLVSALGGLRARLEQRLAGRGLAFDWRIAELSTTPVLGPHRVMSLVRVVQEAITNVIKHAGARTIRVATGEAPDPDGRRGVYVEVADDGCGLPERPGPPGRGLRNMQRRASEDLGGSIAITGPEPGAGTTVRLWIPLEPKA